MPTANEMLPLAVRHHQAGQLDEAERLYRLILLGDPRNCDALHFLGVLHHQSGRNEIALELIGTAIALNGRVPAFHNNLGNALKALGKLDEAVAAYELALAINKDYVEAYYNLGVTLQAQGAPTRAAARYRQALSLSPAHSKANGNLGNILQEQGDLEQAAACYSRALAHAPSYVEAHNNLGNVLRAQGKLDLAIKSYRRTLALKPDFAEAHNNLGIVLFETGKIDEAVSEYKRALELKPDYAAALTNLGNALRELGETGNAKDCYKRALEIQPDFADAKLGLAMAAIPVFAVTIAESVETSDRFGESLDDLSAWVGDHPERIATSVGNHQPFYLAYRPVECTALLRRYGELVCDAATTRWRVNLKRANRFAGDRIRLTIVSGQIRKHPVWDIVLRGLVEHLDRRQFEICLCHTGSITDEETVWADAHVGRFMQGPKPLVAWLDDITRNRPDVIFYPEVGMDVASCAMASLRLAPLQVAGWGHPITTGLSTIDLFVSGELLEGSAAEQHYREKLIRLPGTGVCTQMTVGQSIPWQDSERSANTVRFALCQQPIKFDPADDMLFARIAKNVESSEFWLVSPRRHDWATKQLRDRLAGAFRNEGLDPDLHLRVTPWMPPKQFLGFLDEMDVYLDCPAFSGYTTAWQAIHRGLPIVTLEGQFLRQRLAAGLLRQIGMTNGIAKSSDQYVDRATRFAQELGDPELIRAHRASIRQSAAKADNNLSAVRSFEQMLIDAMSANHLEDR